MPATTPSAAVPYMIGTDALGLVDQRIKDVADWLEAVYTAQCKLFAGATVNTANNGVATTLSFASENWDPSGMHNPAVNPSRITLAKAGRYRVTGQVMWPTNNLGWRYAYLTHNGAVFAQVTQNPVTATETRQQVTGTIVALAGQYVEFGCAQNSGSNLVIVDDNYSDTFFQAEWIGPAF